MTKEHYEELGAFSKKLDRDKNILKMLEVDIEDAQSIKETSGTEDAHSIYVGNEIGAGLRLEEDAIKMLYEFYKDRVDQLQKEWEAM